MYLCEMTGANYMVLQCSKLFYYKVSSEFLQQEFHTVLAKSKMQEKQNFLKKKTSVSLEKDFIFRFHIYFSASFTFYLLISDT